MKPIHILALSAVLMSGCTAINVRPIEPGLNVKAVCIEENPRVIVGDFLPVVRKGFDRHGIQTRIVTKPTPSDCEYLLTYTALKTWDMANYMHHAELRLESNGHYIGSAEYHLKGKGGLSLTKYQSTKTKMDPVIDELLSNINK